ncbi:MAG: class I SAM-dependent methyltransferase [Thermodesulfobacteriota bacterium]
MAFAELKARQSIIWGSGPYEPITELTRGVHDALLGTLEPRAGQRWLDVATGTGAVALRAAAAGAEVTGIDLAPALIEKARTKAAWQGLAVRFEVGDAEELPFPTASFDVVCSAIGTQFAPDHAAVARELARVCRQRGRLGLACWVPDSVVARMFAVMRPFAPPPPPGAGNAFDWGRPEYLSEQLGETFELHYDERVLPVVADSGQAMWELFVDAYGPTRTLAASLEPERREELRRAWVELFERDRSGGAIRQAWRYLLVRGIRR